MSAPKPPLVLHDQTGHLRWQKVAHALEQGAVVSDVADVLGLDDAEVRTGLSAWSGRQHAAGRMSDAERVEVLALVHEISGTS